MIIQSLLDQDLYKFTMAQVVLHHFPDFNATYQLICRTEGVIFTREMVNEIKEEIEHICTCTFTNNELEYLRSIRFLKPWFIDILSLYKPSIRHITIDFDSTLHIRIEGTWFLTIFFEVPLLSIISEVYYKHTVDFAKIVESGKINLNRKIETAPKEHFMFSDFGTRRRFSFAWQDYVIATLSENLSRTIFTGTSNVYFAKKYNLKPIGTMAHEFIQAGQACAGVTLANSQRYMLYKWVDEYKGDLGIALSDTLGLEKFLQDFDLFFAKLYDGVRQDSGDPFFWAETMINHYKNLHIDPKTKKLIFSDSLDFEKAARIWNRFKNEASVAFGIGTNLTNDFDGVKPIQIVIKMIRCNDKPVAKISDSAEKTVSEDQDYLNYLKKIIKPDTQ
ncbi:MAG: nicotinate phosphoribosyltransferase [Fibrobacter sp.]|nr:nicotinate phosphoribosyltransferase [Fibrobacter sp.]